MTGFRFVFINLCILVLWTKVALAFEKLRLYQQTCNSDILCHNNVMPKHNKTILFCIIYKVLYTIRNVLIKHFVVRVKSINILFFKSLKSFFKLSELSISFQIFSKFPFTTRVILKKKEHACTSDRNRLQ